MLAVPDVKQQRDVRVHQQYTVLLVYTHVLLECGVHFLTLVKKVIGMQILR